MPKQLMDPDDLRPVYQRIADDLRDAYTPGGQLPSAPKLAEEWGVAKETIRAALDVLRTEGLIVSWQGRGTFYRVPVDPEEPSADGIIERLDAIMTRLDGFESRLSALEQSPERGASQ
ncbi:winged helix-turn-helix domain-containing protein [Nocardia noduli]|uniref:winged helix-turn-helix domain-containing protein n=1 Tax=Nocardia noduli TaxID=2815722 RepID=UPI0027DF922B|nr:GntR family transcriptional regulator [Nocardia noduli]